MTIQPSPALPNSLWYGFTRLRVSQCPLVTHLGHQFETEDSVLGREHVLRKGVYPVDTLET